MTFAIAKPAAFEGDIYVTKVLKGGLRIDNVIVRDKSRLPVMAWQIKKYATCKAAEKDLQKMREGGFDDYAVVTLEL